MPIAFKPLVVAGLVSALVLPGVAAANPDLEQLIANPNNWAMQAGDMYNQRYSKLKQIDATNVGKMQVAWLFSTGVLRGHEGSPLVVNDTMYIHTPFPNKVFALDLDTQKIKWRYEPKQDAAVIPQMPIATAISRGIRMKHLPPPAPLTITPVIRSKNHKPPSGSISSLAQNIRLYA